MAKVTILGRKAAKLDWQTAYSENSQGMLIGGTATLTYAFVSGNVECKQKFGQEN
jgi:hypothetical protein